MKIMKYKSYKIISAAVVALMFIGCKPTEQNYRNAYDAALAKRQQAAEEQMRPATGLLSDEGPMMRVIKGDTIFVQSEALRTLDSKRLPGRMAIAVGLYKMDTNAKASAEDLTAQGYPQATAARARGDRYYTIALTSANMDSLIMEVKNFREKFPEYPYVGLPGSPVIISF